MPLRSLRPGRSERDLKRRSTLDPAGFFKRADKDARFDRSADNLDPGRIAASEDGYRPTSTDIARPSTGHDDDDDDDSPPSPPVQEHTPNTKRFSLMRFRHASDPQLSAKAKEHAARDDDAPPVPRVPGNPARTYMDASHMAEGWSTDVELRSARNHHHCTHRSRPRRRGQDSPQTEQDATVRPAPALVRSVHV